MHYRPAGSGTTSIAETTAGCVGHALTAYLSNRRVADRTDGSYGARTEFGADATSVASRRKTRGGCYGDRRRATTQFAGQPFEAVLRDSVPAPAYRRFCSCCGRPACQGTERSRPGFTATPVTLDVFTLYLRGRLDAASVPPRPPSLVENPEAASLYHAHMAVFGVPSWSRATLSKYALARSLQGSSETAERRSQFIIGGLYHVERLADPKTAELLLTRLVDVLHESRATFTERRELAEALEVLEELLTDTTTMRRLGALQAELAIANPTRPTSYPLRPSSYRAVGSPP